MLKTFSNKGETNAIPLNAENVNFNFTELDNRSISESGRNDAGSYIKFNDGTMICFGYNSYGWQPFELNGSLYFSNELTFELPQEFKLDNQRTIVAQAIGESGIYWCTSSYFKSDKSAGIKFAKITGENLDLYFRYLAIGKWK
jgi:hypothetical protein